MRGGGKTVFITAIVHHLLLGRELPFLSAVQEERLLGAQPDAAARRATCRRSRSQAARAALAAAEPSWPAPTERLSALRLRLRFVAKGALRRRLGEHRSLNLEIIDYPGEWLLDLPLLEQSYAVWSAQTLAAAERAAARRARQRLAELSGGPRSERAGRSGARRRRPQHSTPRYLARCQAEAGLSLLQPGRFTMPGDLAGSELLQFCPLPHDAASRSGAAAASQHSWPSATSAIATRWCAASIATTSRRFDRQIVLVDLLGALNRGRACFDDVEAALGTVLQSFRYGPSGLLARLFRPRIEALLFAASKADHVAHNQHHNLRLLLEQMVREAAGNARFEGIKPAFVSLAALRSTDVVRTDHHGQALSCVRGILKGENRETVLFPGEIPPDLPVDDDWSADRFRFRDFAPRRLVLQGADKPQHIRLDQALEVLLGDRLQ